MDDQIRTRIDMPAGRRVVVEGFESASAHRKALVSAAARRRHDWGLSREARRRNVRLMLLLLGDAPLSRQA
jgi:hypothetical protein